MNINDMASIQVPQRLLDDIAAEKQLARQKRREAAQKRREELEAKKRAEDLLTFAACFDEKLEVCRRCGCEKSLQQQMYRPAKIIVLFCR
eukprot:SAG11_NODE_552_length_8583_cov_3.699081_12_plen_90_part_00